MEAKRTANDDDDDAKAFLARRLINHKLQQKLLVAMDVADALINEASVVNSEIKNTASTFCSHIHSQSKVTKALDALALAADSVTCAAHVETHTGTKPCASALSSGSVLANALTGSKQLPVTCNKKINTNGVKVDSMAHTEEAGAKTVETPSNTEDDPKEASFAAIFGKK